MKLWQRYNLENEEDLTLDERAFEYFLLSVLNISYQGQSNAFLAEYKEIKKQLNQEEEDI